MNPETGRIYYGADAIEAAKRRGEWLIELSPGVMQVVSEAQSLGGVPLSAVGPTETAPEVRAKRFKKAFAVTAGLVLVGMLAAPVRAAEHRYAGNVELRAPVWTDAAGAAAGWRGLELAGDLRISHVLGPIGFRVQGEHTFRQAGVFKPENKLKAGLELPLPHAWTAFAYWDRRFNEPVNRVFVGVRFGFGGSL